jgi:hypothetical protein
MLKKNRDESEAFGTKTSVVEVVNTLQITEYRLYVSDKVCLLTKHGFTLADALIVRRAKQCEHENPHTYKERVRSLLFVGAE